MNVITDYANSMGPDLKRVVTAVLWVACIGFAIKPATKAMKEFGDKSWGAGFLSALAVVALVVIAIIVPVLLFSLGKSTGNDLNQKASGLNLLVPVIAMIMYSAYSFLNERKQKVKKSLYFKN